MTFSCSAGPAAGNQGTPAAAAEDDDDSAGGKTCAFQFWIEQVESFYCALSECDWQTRSTYNANVTEYSCQKIQCDCVPGRMLCGEDGSVSEWSAFALHGFPPLRDSDSALGFGQTSTSFYSRRSKAQAVSLARPARAASSRSRR